jgi:endonuclease/exonuclease/phosphatase family metal-dependent hydrolase
MKALKICLLLLVLFLLGSDNQKTLTVMSYNVHSGIGIDKKLDLDRIADVIIQEKADIVALNEIESNVSKTKCVNQIEYIAKKTNMYFAFGPNLIGNNGCKGRGEFGNAVLSKYKITKSINHKLYRKGKEEPRGCLETEIEVDGKKVAFLTTHLDCHREEDIRNNQARDILKIISEKDCPVIFAGDMNAYLRTDGNDVENAAKIFSDNLYDSANANPSQKTVNTLISGKNRIDFIFVNKTLANSVLSYKVVNYGDANTASDHYPVVSMIKME